MSEPFRTPLDAYAARIAAVSAKDRAEQATDPLERQRHLERAAFWESRAKVWEADDELWEDDDGTI